MPYTKKFAEPLVKHENEVSTKEEQLLNAPYGQQGAVIITKELADVKGDFYCIIALRDDVVLQSDLTDVNWKAAISASPTVLIDWPQSAIIYDIPLPVGMPFYGNFKSIQLKDMSAIVQDYCDACPKLIAYYR